MGELIIGATFVFGMLVVLIGIFAFFRNLRGQQATFKVAGMELSGTGAMFIVGMGAVLMLSGFGWASTQKEAVIAQNQAQESQRQTVACVADKTELVKQAAIVRAGTLELAQRNEALLAAMSTVSGPPISAVHPELLAPPPAVRSEAFRAAMKVIEQRSRQ